eukprot:78934-Pelagomonas_calceolata.AAC.4
MQIKIEAHLLVGCGILYGLLQVTRKARSKAHGTEDAQRSSCCAGLKGKWHHQCPIACNGRPPSQDHDHHNRIMIFASWLQPATSMAVNS